MKTTVITLISLLFMIPLSYASNDGENTVPPKAKKEAVTAVESRLPAAELVVINLNEQVQDDLGLPQDIIDQLDHVMAYPKDVKDAADKECVLVGFTYDDDGYIHVKNTTSSNPSFDDHVKTNIEKIRLRNGSVTIGKEYYAKFSFKKL
ncbi:MAG TPA: hypothetical protein VK994_05580 [Bacteroidales bacterium]|nr:hypothetical protein [Bacteroidales bacterium]